LKDSEQVYWIKAGLAVLTGVLCMYLNNYIGVLDTVTVMIGVSIYFAASEALSILRKYDRNRTIRIGIGAFLFLWIFTWTLLNTIVKAT